jgi:hypothetical protein
MRPASAVLGVSAALLAGSAGAMTWTPAGVTYATGHETVATPGAGTKTCGAFWNLNVTKAGAMRVLDAGAPECGVTAYGLPWRIQPTGPTTAVIRNVWFQGMSYTFCQGDVTVKVQPDGALILTSHPMAAGCSLSATIVPTPGVQIAQ